MNIGTVPRPSECREKKFVLILCLIVFLLSFTESFCARNNVPDGLYAHPADCHLILFCVHKSYVVVPCPAGLIFNPHPHVISCDWSYNVDVEELCG